MHETAIDPALFEAFSALDTSEDTSDDSWIALVDNFLQNNADDSIDLADFIVAYGAWAMNELGRKVAAQ